MSSSNWRGRLYLDPKYNFPPFARLRLIYEALRVSKPDFREIIRFDGGDSSLKNILDGKVTNNPLFSKGSSALDLETLQEAVDGLREYGQAIQIRDLTDDLDEAAFLERLRPTRLSPKPVNSTSAPPESAENSGVPIYQTSLMPWSDKGKEILGDVASWLTSPGRVDMHLGIEGPVGAGKTALVSTAIHDAGLSGETLWFDCEKFKGHEFMIDIFAQELLRSERDSYDQASILRRKFHEKADWINERLAKKSRLIVLDSFHLLLDQNGALGETVKDPGMLSFLNEAISVGSCRLILISQNSTAMFPSVTWLSAEGLYDVSRLPARERLRRKTGKSDLSKLVSTEKVRREDRFPAEDVVLQITAKLKPDQLKLFVFLALVGEEVRHSTIVWYISECLGIGDVESDEFFSEFWQDCAECGAKATKYRKVVPDDNIDDPKSPAHVVHYKFHHAIVVTAQRIFSDAPDRFRYREVHRQIALRAAALMHDRVSYYDAVRVVGRFTRPAQTIKHLLLSTADRLRPAPGDIPVIPPDGNEYESFDNRTVVEAISRDSDAADDTYLFCFAGIYRQFIDRKRKYDLSNVNGADSEKVNLLGRFFQPPLHRRLNFEEVRFPPLPINRLCDLLSSLAVAGLNSGELRLANWAAEKALDCLRVWDEQFKRDEERDGLLTSISRVHFDILVRRGDLLDARAFGEAALAPNSAFRAVASTADLQKLQVRFGNLIYMLEGIGNAMTYIEKEIGLKVGDIESSWSKGFVALSGQSGRLWVSLLLRTLPGQKKDGKLLILDQIEAIHAQNEDSAGSRSNEEVALAVERSIIRRISRKAIADRAGKDLVEYSALPKCEEDLHEVRRRGFRRGVSPTTRLDLEIELAKIAYLKGDVKEALEAVEDVLTTSVRFGYKCYEYDMLMLKAEMLWHDHRVDEAEKLFDRLLVLESDTGYKSLHSQRLLIQVDRSPLRAYPG